MLKIRIMGTKNEINWFKEILHGNSQIDILEFSDFYSNKGTERFYRVYVELRRKYAEKK